MSSEPAFRLGIACEDRGHFDIVTFLSDWIIVQEVDWIDEDELDTYRCWCGRYRNTAYYPLKMAKDDFKKASRDKAERLKMKSGRPIKLHGHINGEPLAPEATMVRRILAIFEKCTDVRPDAVFLVRDLDRQPQIRSGFEQVRNGYTWSFPVLFAFPDPEIEAWEVIGCEPDGRDGKRCLQKLKKQLSFDPCKQPHRLTSRPNDAPTDAKRVQKKLTNNDRNQIKEGLLRYLRKADKKSRPGEACGLDAFLEEVRSHLIPVFKEYSPKIV